MALMAPNGLTAPVDITPCSGLRLAQPVSDYDRLLTIMTRSTHANRVYLAFIKVDWFSENYCRHYPLLMAVPPGFQRIMAVVTPLSRTRRTLQLRHRGQARRRQVLRVRGGGSLSCHRARRRRGKGARVPYR